MHTTNHNPGDVGAAHSCKTPLWGRHLDIDSLYQTPRFAHRPLQLVRFNVVKNRPQVVSEGAVYARRGAGPVGRLGLGPEAALGSPGTKQLVRG